MRPRLLYTHQQEGAYWIGHRDRAYLGDPPGFGKTGTLLGGLAVAGARRPLIVCPAIVRTHWHREGTELGWQQSGFSLLNVKSYDEIVRGGYGLMAELLRFGVDALVLDEAHYLKHANSKRTQLLVGKDGYARRIPRVWLASGTPMPRNPAELWTQFCYVFPETIKAAGFRTYEQWRDHFCILRHGYARGKPTEKVVGVKNVDELRAILGEVMLQRSLAEIGLDVPQIWWQTVRLNSKYEQAGEGAIFQAGLASIREGESLEAIANEPHIARMRRRLGELKVAPVAEMLTSQLADGSEKVVVFAHHRNVLAGLRELLRPFGVAYVDGDVLGPARDAEIDRFQADPRCRVFVGQTIACQTGITLTAASRVVLVEPDWTATVNSQAGHRVARIGQTAERCVVQMIALADTLDEAIVTQNRRETEMAAAVLRKEVA